MVLKSSRSLTRGAVTSILCPLLFLKRNDQKFRFMKQGWWPSYRRSSRAQTAMRPTRPAKTKPGEHPNSPPVRSHKRSHRKKNISASFATGNVRLGRNFCNRFLAFEITCLRNFGLHFPCISYLPCSLRQSSGNTCLPCISRSQAVLRRLARLARPSESCESS